MRDILAANYLDQMEGNFGDAFPNIEQGLQSINSALGASGGKDFKGIVDIVITSILNPVTILLLALALVYFMWGVMLYVGRGAEQGDREKGIQMMGYGILAMFVMVSVWGLVYILINTFGLDNTKPPIPKL